MHKNVLFRGCTRPAMFMGVPYVPFFVGAGGSLLLAMYFGLQFLLLIPIVIFVMRQMARRDEMIFNLLWLNLLFRFKVKNRQAHGGMWVFSPHNHRSTPPGTPRRFTGPFYLSGRMTGPVYPKKGMGRAK